MAAKVLSVALKGKPTTHEKPDRCAVVIPYINELSHRLKNVGARHAVQVVCSTPVKLGSLCSLIEKAIASQRRGTKVDSGCKVAHMRKFVECSLGTVYKVPHSCKK